MTIIEIAPLENGAHRNQSGDKVTVPEGWAILPADMDTPHFPFGSITVDDSTPPHVTGWTAGEVLEPEPEPEPEPSIEDRIQSLEAENTLLKAQVQAQSDSNDFLEDCIAEMATIVYA